MIIRNFILAAAVALSLSPAANAAVVTGAITGGQASPGTFEILLPPFEVGRNDQQDNDTLFAWNEVQGLTLGSFLLTDYGVIAAGTEISSHGIVFDPRRLRTMQGYVEFDGAILGVISSTTGLFLTDGLLGHPDVDYDTPLARGLEWLADGYQVVGNRIYLDFSTSSPGDNLRVLTAASLSGAVPEPASWAMLITGFGLVGMAARRRSAGARVSA